MLKKSDNRGFTFIELILYIGILSIFMVAVVTLIGSTVASNSKVKSRKKLQTQATETYDAIADMLMGATDVRIRGQAWVGVTTSGVTSYSKKDANFVIPGSYDGTGIEDMKDGDGVLVKKGSLVKREQSAAGPGSVPDVSECYDIADIKPFLESSTPSSDEQTCIDVKYISMKYASGIDETTKDNIYTYCTLKYDETDRNIYVYRYSSDEVSFNEQYSRYYLDYSSEEGNILCKNVDKFQLQVNPETGTFAIIMEFSDPKAGTSYDINGVVSLRNSFVLKSHEWN